MSYKESIIEICKNNVVAWKEEVNRLGRSLRINEEYVMSYDEDEIDESNVDLIEEAKSMINRRTVELEHAYNMLRQCEERLRHHTNGEDSQ